MPEKILRAAIYARVSTLEQSQEGLSLGAQEERCRAFAFAKGWSLAPDAVYVDGGYSGKNLHRPAMQRLLSDAHQGRWDILISWRLDRISRRQKDILTLLEDVLTPHDIGLQSATEPFETTTPMGKAMLGMLAVFAQLERETIIERTKMGRRASFQLGRWQGGKIPWGYQHTGTKGLLAPDPAVAPWVRELFAKAATGMGPHLLAQWLEQEHVRPPGGTIWYPRSIWMILQSPVYVGEVQQRQERLDGQSPALIDRATWEATQRHLHLRKTGPKVERPEFLVDGILSCPLCGEPYRGLKVRANGLPPSSYDNPEQRYRYYYVCARAHRTMQHLLAPGKPGCHARMWRQSGVDAQVVAQIQAWQADPMILEGELRRQWPEIEAIAPTTAAEELAQVRQRIQRWYDAYEQGAIGTDDLRQRTDALLRSQAALETQLAIPTPVRSTAKVRGLRDELQAFVLDLGARWDLLSPLDRQHAVREIIEGGIISPSGQVTLTLLDRTEHLDQPDPTHSDSSSR